MLPAHDPFIEVLEQASAMTSGAGATGGTLIDVFPMCQSITPLTHPHTLTKRLYFFFSTPHADLAAYVVPGRRCQATLPSSAGIGRRSDVSTSQRTEG